MSRLSSAGRILAGVGLLSAIAGAVLQVAGGTGTVAVIGAGLLGLAGISLVALVFLLVGESEDRDRDRNPRG